MIFCKQGFLKRKQRCKAFGSPCFCIVEKTLMHKSKEKVEFKKLFQGSAFVQSIQQNTDRDSLTGIVISLPPHQGNPGILCSIRENIGKKKDFF